MANSSTDKAVSAFGGSQDPNQDDYLATSGGARITFPTLPAPAIFPTQIAGGSGWSPVSGLSAANNAAYPKSHPSGRASGLILTKNPVSGTFGQAGNTAITPFKMTDYALIGMDLLPTLVSGSVTIRLSSDNFATKRMEYSWPLPSEIYNGDWNRVTARTNADGTIDPNGGTWISTGGMTTAETVNAVRITVNSAANDAATVAIDSVFGFTGAPVRGVVMFGFDRYTDASLPTTALAIAQKYSITCYAAGDTDLISSKGTGYARVKQLYDAGWPIISQGPDHKNYVSSGSTVLYSDYAASRAMLQYLGLDNALDFFAYPFSANNTATDSALLAQGCRMATTGIAWNGHPNEYNLGFKLVGMGRLNIGGLTLTQVKRLIDRAVTYGVVVDLFCHGLIAGGDGTTPPADTLLWYANDWDAAIAYAKAYADAGTLDIHNPVTLFNARGALPVRV